MDPAEIILWKCGGPHYRTRDGRLAAVSESNAEFVGGRFVHLWQGRCGDMYCEWDRDGTHRGGDVPADPGLDLVEAAP